MWRWHRLKLEWDIFNTHTFLSAIHNYLHIIKVLNCKTSVPYASVVVQLLQLHYTNY